MSFSEMTDDELLACLKEFAANERRCVADMVACLAEVDRRGNIGRTAFPTLFDYCVGELKVSRASAYRRLRAVRVANEFPESYALLRHGLASVETLAMIEPFVKERPALLKEIEGKNRDQVEAILAPLGSKLAPRDSIRLYSAQAADSAAADRAEDLGLFDAPVPDVVLDSATPSEPQPQPRLAPPPAIIQAEVRFSAGEDFLNALARLKAALWHKFPDGSLQDVLFEAVREFLEKRDPARPRRAATGAAAQAARQADPHARRPPAAVEREVRLRDGERCTFTAGDGQRCEETRGLEIDHVIPWAKGGRSDDPANLRLLCRAHNQHEARRVFGELGLGA